jgi:hypothetical protein
LAGILMLDAADFADAIDSGALANATMACQSAMCNPLNTECRADVTTLVECNFPLSKSSSSAALNEIASGLMSMCPNPIVPDNCNATNLMAAMGTFSALCSCGPTTSSEDCYTGICGGGMQCMGALASLQACSAYVDFETSAMIMGLGAIAMTCDVPNFDPKSCQGTALGGLLSNFHDACTSCTMDANFDPAACTTDICHDAPSPCSEAYGALALCYGLLDWTDVQANITAAILPFGGPTCNVDVATECSLQAITPKLSGLEVTCGCDPTKPSAACLAHVAGCDISPQCAMEATNLIAECSGAASSLGQTYETIFTQATSALLACAAPKCVGPKYELVGPYQVAGVECCDGAKGKHGDGGSCCLPNPAQSDPEQPNAYVDQDGKPCCYDGTKGHGCPLKGSASSVAAGVATVAAIVALLL